MICGVILVICEFKACDFILILSPVLDGLTLMWSAHWPIKRGGEKERLCSISLAVILFFFLSFFGIQPLHKSRNTCTSWCWNHWNAWKGRSTLEMSSEVGLITAWPFTVLVSQVRYGYTVDRCSETDPIVSTVDTRMSRKVLRHWHVLAESVVLYA
jgi:hypothetical protein